MPLTRYHYSQAVSAFFEFPTSNARRILPPHLQPLEVQHESSILAITAFDFADSMVGPYQEIVLSVIVPPLVRPGQEMAKSAFYPFLVGTSTEASREHAIERWHLPHYMKDLDITLTPLDGRMRVEVREGDRPVLEMEVSDHRKEAVDHLYQSFMVNADHRFKVDIHMRGPHSEHEEESGSLKLYDHPMTSPLDPDEVATFPFREQWMTDGVQVFEELERI
ncbi:MAG: acetoacetate decarboxylase family protein [Gemmatimonadota bacterium]|nr:acetoacetate decarboxylase family protein [Gemmatimonadota bacterium]